MHLPNRPRPVIRDAMGYVVQPEHWTQEQRTQFLREEAEQFSQGEQLTTLQELREEMKLRWAYVDSWEENAAVNKWILRQIDGMIAAEPQTNNGTTFS